MSAEEGSEEGLGMVCCVRVPTFIFSFGLRVWECVAKIHTYAGLRERGEMSRSLYLSVSLTSVAPLF